MRIVIKSLQIEASSELSDWSIEELMFLERQENHQFVNNADISGYQNFFNFDFQSSRNINNVIRAKSVTET